MNAWQRYGTLIARLALAAIFIHAGLGKLMDPAGTAVYIAGKGLPAPFSLAIAAGLVELLGGLALVLGLRTRVAAVTLALFLIPTTLFFHNPSGLDAAAAQMQATQVYKNLAIFGGLLALASWGAGPLALEAHRRPPLAAPAEPAVKKRAA